MSKIYNIVNLTKSKDSIDRYFTIEKALETNEISYLR